MIVKPKYNHILDKYLFNLLTESQYNVIMIYNHDMHFAINIMLDIMHELESDELICKLIKFYVFPIEFLFAEELFLLQYFDIECLLKYSLNDRIKIYNHLNTDKCYMLRYAMIFDEDLFLYMLSDGATKISNTCDIYNYESFKLFRDNVHKNGHYHELIRTFIYNKSMRNTWITACTSMYN